jgi:DNA processing protein
MPNTLVDSQLPPRVADLPCPPRVLYVCGMVPTRPIIALVGTRRPTKEAVLFTETLAMDLVAHGFAVASGGAAGIDSAAHRGALRANGQTLVVAPSGWSHPYPAENRDLFKQIVAHRGCYLSLVAPDCRVMPSNFFARNALMVALADATVVIQAPVRSGARNAAHVARKLGRQLYVVPSAPWTEQGLGCILELKLGARPLGGIRDLLAGLCEIGVHGSNSPVQLKLPLSTGARVKSTSRSVRRRGVDGAQSRTKLEPEDRALQTIMHALEQGCGSVDQICAATGWAPPKVQAALLRLTLDGHIRVTSAGKIETVTN